MHEDSQASFFSRALQNSLEGALCEWIGGSRVNMLVAYHLQI